MKKLLILLLVFINVACTHNTTKLWKKTSQDIPFQENIHAIYISEENQQILFFGEKYHYALEADPLFKFALRYGTEEDVQYSVSSATIYPADGKAQVSFNMKLASDKHTSSFLTGLHKVASEQLASLTGQPRTTEHIFHTRNIHSLETAMGSNENTPVETKALKIHMAGKFYQASDTVNQAVTPLQTPFQLHINKREYTSAPLPLRIALTPFSVASDGVLTVGAIAIGVTAITVLAIAHPDFKK